MLVHVRVGDGDSSGDGTNDSEEDDVPKVPRVDAYYVVLAVILGGTLLGILIYFSSTYDPWRTF